MLRALPTAAVAPGTGRGSGGIHGSVPFLLALPHSPIPFLEWVPGSQEPQTESGGRNSLWTFTYIMISKLLSYLLPCLHLPFLPLETMGKFVLPNPTNLGAGDV